MSDTTNPQTVEIAEPTLQVIDKGPYVIEENRFGQGGKLEGLGYFVLQFRNGTDEEANNSVKAIIGQPEIKDAQGNVVQTEAKGKWSAKQLIALVNSAINSSQRVKAQQIILAEDKDKQPQAIVNRLKNNPILYSAEDADKWVPGERDLSIQGMMRKAADLIKQGKNQEAMALMMEAQKQMVEELAKDNQQA